MLQLYSNAMVKKRFSVVIPALNEEKYLPRLLNALARQTYTDFEVVVVDGGSRDDTQKIVREYKAFYPLFLKVSQRKNVGLQRNVGAFASQGEYLVFFDADVTIFPDYFATIVKRLQKRPIGIATTRFVPDSPSLLDHFLTHLCGWGIQASLILGKPFMSGQNLIIRRDIFNHVGGFDKTVIHGEDCDLVQRVVKAHYLGEFLKSPTHVVSFRRLRKEGRMEVIWKYTLSFFYQIIRGPIRSSLFAYEMGGQAN